MLIVGKKLYLPIALKIGKSKFVILATQIGHSDVRFDSICKFAF